MHCYGKLIARNKICNLSLYIVCLELLCIYACYSSGADLESLKRGCTTIDMYDEIVCTKICSLIFI